MAIAITIFGLCGLEKRSVSKCDKDAICSITPRRI